MGLVNGIGVGVPFYTQGGPSFSGLLDTYTGATVAYSTRWLNSSYSGALIRIRRSSDSAEKDFYPDSNNELSMSSEDGAGTSLSSWISTDSGYAAKFYDQSGNSNDLIQTTAGSQPTVVNAGTLIVSAYNGKAAIDMTSTVKGWNLSSTIATTQLCYAHHVFDRSASGKINTGLQNTPSGQPATFVWFSNNTIFTRVGGSALTSHDTSQTQTGDFLATVLRDSSDNVKYWLNGSAGTTKNYANSAQTYGKVGSYYQDNQIFQEIIYWNTDQESNRSGIESDTNTYFGIW